MDIGIILGIIYTIGFILTIFIIKTLRDLGKIDCLNDEVEHYFVAMLWPGVVLIVSGYYLFMGVNNTFNWITRGIALCIQNLSSKT